MAAPAPAWRARHLLVLVALCALYVLAGRLGLRLAFIHANASAVWPPTGIALAACLLLGVRAWPAIFVGAFLVNVTSGAPVAISLGIALGNTLEAVVGAGLVTRFAGGTATFDRARDIFKFAVLAGTVATAISASVGTASLVLGRYAAPAQLAAIWTTWWLGDAVGAVIVTPLVVLWSRDRSVAWRGRRLLEALGLLAATIVIAQLVFTGIYPLAFLCMPGLVWAAFRFGPREAATLLAVLSVIALAGTLRGLGPFGARPPHQALVILQAFLGTMAGITVPVAAMVVERWRSEVERERLLNLEQSARAHAELANRMKDEFLATLSHELRTPLNAILGWVRLLGDDRLEAAARTRGLATIERNTRLQIRLIDDLLDVSRIVSGQVRLELRPTSLATVVEASVDAVRTAAEAKRITLEVALDRSLPPVLGDVTRLQQAVANLLSNALKFTPEGGQITVRLDRAEGRALVAVRDSGKGIAPEFLPQVFEPFRQADSTTTRTYGGLGIGLSIVRHLVSQHGGVVHADSPGEGRGATFTIELPLAPGRHEEPGPEASRPAPVSLDRLTVLVVDDDRDGLEMVQAVLERYGATVIPAASARHALDALARATPDVMLADIAMPEVDGYELIRRVRTLGADRGQVPAAALTAYAGREDRDRALAAGFQAHMAKPVEPEALARLVAELAGRG